MVGRAPDVTTQVLSANPDAVTEGLGDFGWDTSLL